MESLKDNVSNKFLCNFMHELWSISPTFYKHIYANFLLPKEVRTFKCKYKKAVRKMVVKMTPGNMKFCTKNVFGIWTITRFDRLILFLSQFCTAPVAPQKYGSLLKWSKVTKNQASRFFYHGQVYVPRQNCCCCC
jgi:hypothetical protein